MNEDDTFRVLRRATPSEMWEIIIKEFTSEVTTEKRIAIFERHGWDHREFYRNHSTLLR